VGSTATAGCSRSRAGEEVCAERAAILPDGKVAANLPVPIARVDPKIGVNHGYPEAA